MPICAAFIQRTSSSSACRQALLGEQGGWRRFRVADFRWPELQAGRQRSADRPDPEAARGGSRRQAGHRLRHRAAPGSEQISERTRAPRHWHYRPKFAGFAQWTRGAAIGGGRHRHPSPDERKLRILINMERWRWMPDDLGSFYVWDSVPEQVTRVFDRGKVVLMERIVVGRPTTPTPTFSANMQFITFHPEWAVPEGIKVNEIAPKLQRGGAAAGTSSTAMAAGEEAARFCSAWAASASPTAGAKSIRIPSIGRTSISGAFNSFRGRGSAMCWGREVSLPQ